MMKESWVIQKYVYFQELELMLKLKISKIHLNAFIIFEYISLNKSTHYMKYLFCFLIILIVACTNEKEERDRFLTTYKEILYVRETVTDSLEANSQVLAVMEKYGYSEEQFRKKYFELAQNPEKFIELLDSLRQLIHQEIKDIQSQQDTTKQE